jgi:RNA polymerase sigma-32 factor
MGALLRANAVSEPLSAELERELVRCAQRGDAQAAHRLVTAHLRFVFAIADQFMRYGQPFDELVSEGLLGFAEAVRRFDPDRGPRLAGYAALWIRALLRRYTLHNRRIVRPPSSRNARKVVGNLSRARRELAQELGEEPDAALLARALGVETSDIEEIDQVMGKRDVPCDRQDLVGAYEVPSTSPSPEAVVAERELAQRRAEAVARALRLLTPRERRIIAERSLQDEPRQLSDLGSELGVSRERVRQLQNQALAKMRGSLSAVA